MPFLNASEFGNFPRKSDRLISTMAYGFILHAKDSEKKTFV
jgi:hypothetical protein